MELVASTLADLTTGAGLPLLFSIQGARGLVPVGCVVSGAGAGCLIGWALGAGGPGAGARVSALLDAASALAQLCFSAALLFRQAARLDPDTGAGFCAIPLFHAVCMAPPPGAGFARGLTLCLAAATVLSIIIGAVPGAAPEPADAGPTGADYVLLTTNAMFATAWGASSVASRGPAPAAARALGFIVLALLPGLTEGLLRRRQAPPLLVTAGVAALLSAKRQSGHLRLQLERLMAGGPARGVAFRRAQRALMLLAAPALAVAYSFQWGDWRGASWAVLGVLSGRLAAFCVG